MNIEGFWDPRDGDRVSILDSLLFTAGGLDTYVRGFSMKERERGS